MADIEQIPDWEMPEVATRVAFCYTGRDTRWVGECEELYRSEPVIRAVLDRCDDMIRQESGVSLLEVMFDRRGGEQEPNDPTWVYPSVYALQCALTVLWRSVGIRPNVVVGEGPGALAAAEAAGVLSLEEGLRIAVALGALVAGRGELNGGAWPSGPGSALAESDGQPSVPLISPVTGRVVEPADILDVEYWSGQARGPVVLSSCAKTLAGLGVDAVVELGPGTAPNGAFGAAWPGDSPQPVVITTLPSGESEAQAPGPHRAFLRAVAEVYHAGLDISFAGLFAGETRRRIALPGYPFQRRRHWI